MRYCHEDVRAFHLAAGHPVREEPGPIPEARVELRVRLLVEESMELALAMLGVTNADIQELVTNRVIQLLSAVPGVGGEPDLVGIADGIADTVYVAVGAGLEFGIPSPEVWEEVQRSNMAKVSGPRRADGKTMKPEGWQPPDIAGVLGRARP